jgi:hypothetical protein
MAKRIPKTVTDITIWITGKKDEVKGRLLLSSGYIYYFRRKARNATAWYTYQQLIDLFEDHIAKSKKGKTK